MTSWVGEMSWICDYSAGKSHGLGALARTHTHAHTHTHTHGQAKNSTLAALLACGMRNYRRWRVYLAQLIAFV